MSTTDTKPIPLFTLSDKAYDTLKGLVQYILPGLVTFWLAIASLWNLPHANRIAGTITAFTVLLGIFVAISKKKFDKLPTLTDGDLLLDVNEEGFQALTVALEKDPDKLRDQDYVTFRVVEKR